MQKAEESAADAFGRSSLAVDFTQRVARQLVEDEKAGGTLDGFVRNEKVADRRLVGNRRIRQQIGLQLEAASIGRLDEDRLEEMGGHRDAILADHLYMMRRFGLR